MKKERYPADMPRREFLKNSSLLAFLATITIEVVGCDGEKDEVVSVDTTAAPQTSLPNQQPSRSSTSEPAAEPTPRPPPPRPTPDPTPDPMPMMCRDISDVSTVDANHSHPFTLSAAAQEAEAAVVIRLELSGNHSHSVRLTGAEVASICAGNVVVKESSSDAFHTHAVMFNV